MSVPVPRKIQMVKRLFLLPGWGLGCAPLEPLAGALQDLDAQLRVQIAPLPNLDSSAPADWLDALDASLPEDVWLGGWSLGGMLAAELAARRGARCRGLLTLASNPCFVARADWPNGMSAQHFAAFRDGCLRDAPGTLKRFGLLCAQGAADPRSVSRRLLGAAPQVGAESLLAGLDVLAALDTRGALQAFQGPQLHLLASADGLVPAAVGGYVAALLADREVGLIEQAGHAFILERPEQIAATIQTFLYESADDSMRMGTQAALINK
jgi:pimeloyl-[acyl-carrier protein] methyl ester esterase